MTSHNAGVKFVPFLAISVDWVHFMAVSIWIGGLFYISTILLSAVRSRSTTGSTTEISPTTTKGTPMPSSLPTVINATNAYYNKKPKSGSSQSITYYYLALLLPRFSLIATISLGVIGISGLYMAWIHLHTLTELFNSAYGNVLIIKLSAALPLVLLGSYHQLRLHRHMALLASIGRGGEKDRTGKVTSISSSTESQLSPVHSSSKREQKIKDIPSKFSKTVKIESFIAIAVLFAASLLTISSPPSMNMSPMAMPSSSSLSSSSSSMDSMPAMPTPAHTKNHAYVNQKQIMDINTKIEISPFYVGFNFFKTIFTDAKGKPVRNISNVIIQFTNTAADIGPTVVNLDKASDGIYSKSGAYRSQPGDWNIRLTAQRTGSVRCKL